MIRKTAIYLLIVSHIFVVSCSSSAPKPSTTVKRAIETREYSVDFDTLMRASIGVLQDLGYTIDVLNDSYGLITASKQTTNIKGKSDDDGPNVYILKTTMNVTESSEDPVSSSIRVNFEASMERGGKIRYAGTQYSSEFFQSFFGALDKSLFLDENLGPEETVIDEEEAPNEVSLIVN